MTLWMIRAGVPSYSKFQNFLQHGIVAIRFRVPENLRLIPDNREMFERLYAKHKGYKKQTMDSTSWQSLVQTDARQLRQFAYDIRIDDDVTTYGGNNNGRIYLRGLITGDYLYSPELAMGDGLGLDYPHIRRVKWTSKLSRDALSDHAMANLGRPLTVFPLDPTTEAEFPRVAGNRL